MVIVQHFWGYATTSRAISPDNPVTVINYLFFQNLLIFCKGGVPFFFLISGYFMSSKKDFELPVHKFLRIWFYAFLYGLLSCILFVHHTPALPNDFKSILRNILPLIGNTYWFITIYLALTLFSPFLAKLSQVLNRSQFQILLFIIVLFGMTFWFGFPFGNAIGVDNGFSLIFAIFLFMVGAFIRQYNISVSSPKKRGLYLLGLQLFCFLFVFFTETRASGQVFVKSGRYNDLSILVAILFFIIIKDWAVKDNRLSRMIVRFSPYVLSIYLIHENIYIREHLWRLVESVCHPDISRWTAIPYAILIPLVVFVSCAVLAALVQWLCRITTVESLLFRLSDTIKNNWKHS